MTTKQSPKIGFVARGLTPGGVSKFITNVLREWNSDKDHSKRIVVFTDEPEYAQQFKNLQVIYIPKKPKIVWDNFHLFKALKKEKLATVVYTKNVIPFTHIFAHWKKVVVVYDMAFFYPELKAYKPLDSLYMKIMTKITLPRADKIMAISQFTKSEIIKFLKIHEDKIFVNYLGVEEKYKKITDKETLRAVVKKYRLNQPFIFYCGSLSPRKNILRLVQAFHQVQDKIPHHLYLISGKTWNNPGIEKYITDNQLQNRIHLLPFIPEDDLIAFYSLADAFVYPSLYEGFGLPIIEAIACDCRLVAINLPASREIGGNRFKYLINDNSEEFSEQLVKMLVHGGIQNGSTSNSIKSGSFSWKTTSARLINQLI